MQDTIRLKNLRLLAFEADGQGGLAMKLGIDYSEMVRYFKNKYTEVSDKFAREIERKMRKPEGWMDRPNFDLALTEDEWHLVHAFHRRRLLMQLLAQIIRLEFSCLGFNPNGRNFCVS